MYSEGKKIFFTGPTRAVNAKTKISCTSTMSPTSQQRKEPFHIYSLSSLLPQFQQPAGSTPFQSLFITVYDVWKYAFSLLFVIFFLPSLRVFHIFVLCLYMLNKILKSKHNSRSSTRSNVGQRVSDLTAHFIILYVLQNCFTSTFLKKLASQTRVQ